MISSQIVMTVGPMIVRTREASVGSPTAAWMTPAATREDPGQEHRPGEPPRVDLAQENGQPEQDERHAGEHELEQAGQGEVDRLVRVNEPEAARDRSSDDDSAHSCAS
jgi:hypothetical protein